MKVFANSHFLKRFRRDDEGVMAVEFAMILPVFLMMLFGTLEIGNVLYAKSTLQQGIETAGRYAMVHIDATSGEIEAEALSRITELGPLSPTFTVVQSVEAGISYSTISVAAEYSVITPFFTGRTIDLTSSMKVPQVDPSEFN